MIELKKYGAIDIGSNAVRLLVANVIEVEGRDPIFRKSSLVRVPIRLGADVFKEKKISEENIQRMIDTMEAFKLLMKSHYCQPWKLGKSQEHISMYGRMNLTASPILL